MRYFISINEMTVRLLKLYQKNRFLCQEKNVREKMHLMDVSPGGRGPFIFLLTRERGFLLKFR
jgi:hypothetical protein